MGYLFRDDRHPMEGLFIHDSDDDDSFDYDESEWEGDWEFPPSPLPSPPSSPLPSAAEWEENAAQVGQVGN